MSSFQFIRSWSYTPTWGIDILSTPVITHDSVFFTSGDTVYQLDVRTGRHQWSHAYVDLHGMHRFFPGFQGLFFYRHYGVPQLRVCHDRLHVLYPDHLGGYGVYLLDVIRHRPVDPEPSYPDGPGLQSFYSCAQSAYQVSVSLETDGRLSRIRVHADPSSELLWDSASCRESMKIVCGGAVLAGPPQVHGRFFVFGLQACGAAQAAPGEYRVYVVDLEKRRVSRRISPQHNDAMQLSCVGVTSSWIWLLLRDCTGQAWLRMHRISDDANSMEWEMPGLTSGVSIRDGVLYGGFGRVFMAMNMPPFHSHDA